MKLNNNDFSKIIKTQDDFQYLIFNNNISEKYLINDGYKKENNSLEKLILKCDNKLSSSKLFKKEIKKELQNINLNFAQMLYKKVYFEVKFNYDNYYIYLIVNDADNLHSLIDTSIKNDLKDKIVNFTSMPEIIGKDYFLNNRANTLWLKFGEIKDYKITDSGKLIIELNHKVPKYMKKENNYIDFKNKFVAEYFGKLLMQEIKKRKNKQ